MPYFVSAHSSIATVSFFICVFSWLLCPAPSFFQFLIFQYQTVKMGNSHVLHLSLFPLNSRSREPRNYMHKHKHKNFAQNDFISCMQGESSWEYWLHATCTNTMNLLAKFDKLALKYASYWPCRGYSFADSSFCDHAYHSLVSCSCIWRSLRTNWVVITSKRVWNGMNFQEFCSKKPFCCFRLSEQRYASLAFNSMCQTFVEQSHIYTCQPLPQPEDVVYSSEYLMLYKANLLSLQLAQLSPQLAWCPY